MNAVLASATPTDFPSFRKDRGSDRPSPAAADPEEQRLLSPLTYVREDAPPILLVHGTADRTVPIVQSERFIEAMRKAGAKDIRLMIFDGDGHGVFQRQRLLTYPAMKAFFAAALKL